MSNTITCPYCGAQVVDMDGPTHRYMLSAPGCYDVFNQVLNRMYTEPAFAAVGNLIVDAYALQHPGEDNPQAVSHVAVHSVSMYAQLETDISPMEVNRLRQAVTSHKAHLHWLQPPGPIWELTVLDVWHAKDAATYNDVVKRWARHCWDGWSRHHEQLLAWYRMATS